MGIQSLPGASVSRDEAKRGIKKPQGIREDLPGSHFLMVKYPGFYPLRKVLKNRSRMRIADQTTPCALL